ncbi:MAG: acetoin dehydrogenase dihydrolipoyllysine-residue acetyltransferase subunit [Sphingobium sp.]|nr:acetoin dehydrogenase dihydrolipoyllysine-residue acetyltransferase subunit [Sphingobium sp.]
MTLHAVTIPKWGLAMEEGTLTSWLVAEGATVTPGEEIAEIETSKITNVLESQVSGVLRRRLAEEGDLKPVGALIGVVTDADYADADIDAFVAEFEARFATEEKVGSGAPVPETLSVDSKPIRFLKIAGSDGADGTPAVLIHGFGGDYLNWMFNQAALATARDVYAIDLPGHGGSTKDVGTATLDSLAETVDAWMAAQGLAKAHVVAHSMGAGVALSLALAHPGRVASLTALCGTGFGGTLNDDYVEGFLAAQKRKDLKPVAALLFADGDLVTREMLEDLIDYKRIDGVPEALRLLIDNALSADAIAALEAKRGDLKAPLLAIYGAEDQVVRTPAADKLPAGAAVIPATGHMPHLEAAEAVNAKIAGFLAAND